MSCPNKPVEGRCLTCRLGGLVRCPDLGTPLPLVEGERVHVTVNTRRWPASSRRVEDVLKLWRDLNGRRTD